MNSCLLWAFLIALKGDSENLQRQSRLEQARPGTGEDAEIRGQGGWGHTLPTLDPQGGGFSPVIRDLGFRVHLCLLHGAGRPCCSVRGGNRQRLQHHRVQVPYLGNSLLQEGELFPLYKFCWKALAPSVLTPK